MIEIRIHGRGGQGVVTAAELIATAAFYDGKFAQASPFFGVERRGAPIEAYARIDDKEIRLRQHIYKPDFIIVQDATLLGSVDVLAGAKKETKVIVNTEKDLSKLLPKIKKGQLYSLPATQIAIKAIGKPLINTALVGAFAAVSGLIKISSIEKAIKERFPTKLVQKNIEAMNLAYKSVYH
jgi:pyruvate ferredoxin oxidoreductase gamma subunit